MTSNRPYLLRAIHAWICDNGLTPHIVVDASKPGVAVPPQAVSDGRVVLNLAPRAVARLDIGNDVITFMARFGGISQSVSVPVAAVQAIYARENGQGMLMVDDPPGTAPAGVDASTAAPAAHGPALQIVREPDADVGTAPEADAADGAAPTGNDGDDEPDKPRPRGKPSLHVVK